MSTIIGYKNPRFRCTAGGDAPSAPIIIDLPLTNSKGMIERNIPITIEDIFLDYSEDIYIEGYHKQWTLNYDEQILGESMLLIDNLYQYFKNGYKIEFWPRSDNTGYIYEVNLKSEYIEFGILHGYDKAQKMRLVILVVKTRFLQSGFNWSLTITPSTEVDVTGFGSPTEIVAP